MLCSKQCMIQYMMQYLIYHKIIQYNISYDILSSSSLARARASWEQLVRGAAG